MNFHDAKDRIGGMVTVGFHPWQKRYEGYSIIFLGEQVFFHSSRGPRRARNDRLFNMLGISCEVLAPLRRLQFNVAADFVPVDPVQVVHGRPLPNITVPAGFDLAFQAFGPPYEFPSWSYAQLAGRADHYEQNGYVTGKVMVGGTTFHINGFGCRDRTWGIRDLTITDRGGAFFAQFSPQLTLNMLWSESGERKTATGYLTRDQVALSIDRAQVQVNINSANLPTSAQAEIGIQDGASYLLEATTVAVMPILWDEEKGRFHWYECLCRFQMGEQVAYGITEIALWREQERGK